MDERTKNYIKGMMTNLQKNCNVRFSSPEQTFAEIVFCITNQAQLKHIESLTHKIQIIAKLLRENRWLTPKGFYNHTDYGCYFKSQNKCPKLSASEFQAPATKQSYHQITYAITQKKSQLNEAKCLLLSEKRCLQDTLAKQNSINQSFLIESIQKRCQSIEADISLLHTEIKLLEQRLTLTSAVKDESKHLQKTKQLNRLVEQAEVIRNRINQQFEVICKVTNSLPKEHPDIDREHRLYQQLNTQLQVVENQIIDLEYELYEHKAA
ncbi:hypothetical protein ACNVED_14775 (plasmid) [Legionella sp. D16C41]|uniref:hypothetical protein n=1 Tax=Legionella sp. D16C41 TaxID=3402688 RepID=UPI003AF424C8